MAGSAFQNCCIRMQISVIDNYYSKCLSETHELDSNTHMSDAIPFKTKSYDNIPYPLLPHFLPQEFFKMNAPGSFAPFTLKIFLKF